jgi:hypothetical protein
MARLPGERQFGFYIFWLKDSIQSARNPTGLRTCQSINLLESGASIPERREN